VEIVCCVTGESTWGTILKGEVEGKLELEWSGLVNANLKISDIIKSYNVEIFNFKKTKGVSNENRFKVYTLAIQEGIPTIDIEASEDEGFIKRLIKLADKKSVKTIISYHNFVFTQNYTELKQLYLKLLEYQSTYVKIVCKTNTIRDNINICKLQSHYPRSISFNISKMGRVSRLFGYSLNAPYFYLSIPGECGKELGQFSIGEYSSINDSVWSNPKNLYHYLD
jgi:3-dehydroquinate dehydratase